MIFNSSAAGDTRFAPPVLQRMLYALLLLLISAVPGRTQTVPSATASSSQQLLASFTNPVVGHMATNAFGDLFYVNSAYSGSAILYQLPHGSTTPVQIATGFSGARHVYVDASNNVYVPNAYSGNILEIPYVNGAYATGLTISGSTATCSSYSPSAPCYQFGSVGAVGGYYYQPIDMGLDANGNAYILNAYANGSCAGNCLLKFTRNNDGSTYTPSLIASNITAQNYNAQVAVTPAGDVAYTDQSKLYLIAAGTTTPKSFATGITSPAGVSTDYLGNLYVTNSASPYTIYEFPALNKSVSGTTQFALLSTYSGGGPAVDSLGDLYYLGYSGGNTLNVAHLNSLPLGASTIGTPVASAATSVTFTFARSTTVSSAVATGSGFTYSAGSCAAGTYAAGGTCTVNVNFTPTAVGLQRGAVTLADGSGVPVAVALLSGDGTGAQQTIDPGSISVVGSGFKSPAGLTVDGSGNVYIADAGQNAVLRYAGGKGTPTTVGAGLNAPNAVAVDNAGNVFIADAGNGRVVEVPLVNGAPSSANQQVIYTGATTLSGIALDFAGNLYIADMGKTTVTELLNIGGIPRSSATVSLGSFNMPSGIATDLNGNLLVTDYGANSAVRINYIGRASRIISTAFSKPTSIAADASGSVYVADSGNARVVKIPLEGTSFNTNDQYLVSTGVTAPFAVAVDSSSNLYISDKTNAAVNLFNRSAATLALGRVQIPQSSSAQNATLASAGTIPLILGTPDFTATSATPAYFSVTGGTSNGCANGTTLQSGFSCTLSAVFTPTTTGAFTDVLTFNSNAAITPNTLTLTGTGVNLAVDTLTLAVTSGTANFGSPVTIQAAVSSSVAGTPSGSISFTVDGNSQGAPVTLSSASVANVTLTGLTGGTHAVCGSYTGDNNYRPSNNCITVTVNKVNTGTALQIVGVGANPVTSAVTQSVTLTATVTAGASTPPTGTVTFTAGTLLLGTAPLTASSTSYVATLQTTALTAGTDVVTATYSGDVNYLTSAGNSSIIVTYPTVIVTPANNTVTMGKTGAGALTLTVTSLGGFNGSIGLACSGLPANTICTFSPNQFLLAVDAPQTVTMQILTGQTPVIPQPVVGSLGRTPWQRALVLLTLLPLWAGQRRLRRKGLWRGVATLSLLLVFGAASVGLTGCTSGSGLVGNTPTGNYSVTVTAAATYGLSSTTMTYPYGTGYASGCTATPAASTNVTCTETAGVSLTVQ